MFNSCSNDSTPKMQIWQKVFYKLARLLSYFHMAEAMDVVVAAPAAAIVPAAAGAHAPAGEAGDAAGAAAGADAGAALPAAPPAAVVPPPPAAPAAPVPPYTKKSGSSDVWDFMHPLDEPQSCDSKCSSAKCKGKRHTFICTTCLAALGDDHWQECLFGMEGGVVSTSNFNGHAKRCEHHLNASAPMALEGDAVERAKRARTASTITSAFANVRGAAVRPFTPEERARVDIQATRVYLWSKTKITDTFFREQEMMQLGKLIARTEALHLPGPHKLQRLTEGIFHHYSMLIGSYFQRQLEYMYGMPFAQFYHDGWSGPDGTPIEGVSASSNHHVTFEALHAPLLLSDRSQESGASIDTSNDIIQRLKVCVYGLVISDLKYEL